jgi:hypothetical protein
MLLAQQTTPVMAGLDPAIHDFEIRAFGKSWMPGTRPGMTASIFNRALHQFAWP